MTINMTIANPLPSTVQLLLNVWFLGPRCTELMELMSTLLDLRPRVVGGREFSGVLGEEEAFSIAGPEEEDDDDDAVAGAGEVVVMDFLEEIDALTSRFGWTPPSTSETMMPKIQQLMMKNAKPAAKRPGTNVLRPRNSNWYPC